MDNNWRVKLHRKLLDNPISTNLELIGLILVLLLKANHKENTFYLGGKKVTVKEWQFISSQAKLAIEFWVSRSKMIRLLNVLDSEKIVNTKWYSKYTVFTLLNWSKYQTIWTPIDTTSDTTSEHQSIQQVNTNKNDKNVKEWKEEIFEQFWILYPNKKWKKKAEEFFSRKIKTQSDFNELLQWLENYKTEHNEKKELWQFVAERQQGDTFLSKETRKEYLEVEKDDITVFQEYVTRYPEDYEYAHKLVAKRWEEKYLEVKAQIAEQQKKALIIQLTK